MYLMRSESSHPITDTSSGTDNPCALAARIAPKAIRSEPQMMALTPWPSKSTAARAPPSTEKTVSADGDPAPSLEMTIHGSPQTLFLTLHRNVSSRTDG